jgi:putative transposase
LIDQRPTLGSAGCVGTRTSGAEGGGGQTTARERGTAARLRPYIDTVRTTQRNVKNWSSGEMGLRWTSAGMLEAEKQFRKVIGYLDLPRLAVAIEHRLHLPQPNTVPTQETAIAVTV